MPVDGAPKAVESSDHLEQHVGFSALTSFGPRMPAFDR